MDGRGDTALGPPTLVVTSDDGTERTFTLGQGALLIGRATGNDVVLSGAEKGASRRHAELRFDDGRYVVVDLESQNGTWVNGERVHRAVVVPGTEIVIGLYRLRLEYGRPPATDIPLRRPEVPAPGRPAPVEPRRSGPTWTMVAAAVILAVAAVGFAAWRTSHGSASSAPPAPVAAPPVIATPPSSDAVPDPAAAGASQGAAAADTVAPPGSAQAAAVRTPPAGGTPSPTRLAALSAFQAGVKLDAAGDWVGALRKFDEARQLDPTVPDLDRTQNQVAGKMRDAGYAALQRAIDLERQGKLTDAAKEYDRAIQWLPADDRRRAIAADRAAQLKEGTK